jgi:hypothetical protein
LTVKNFEGSSDIYQFTFEVSGVGSFTFNVTSGSLISYSKYVDNQRVGTVISDANGTLTDTITLGSVHVITYVRQIGGTTTGSWGGGGGGYTSQKWCAKEGRNIPESEWTEERCEPEATKEIRIREARIVYFGHNEVELPLAGFKVPLLEKQYCSIYFGKPERCRKPAVEVGKTVYVVGGVYSTYGMVTPEGYRWWVVDINGNEVLRRDGSPEFTVVFSEEGNFTLYLEIIDSEGNRYTANHSFVVVSELVPPEEERGNKTLTIPKLDTTSEVPTFADEVAKVLSTLPNTLKNWFRGFNLRLPDSASVDGYKIATAFVALFAVYLLVGGGSRWAKA